MPAAVTHIAIAEKVFAEFFSGQEKSDFMIGLLFPDIRYLAGLKKEETHLPGVKLADCREDHAFWAGFKFHSLTDTLLDNFILGRSCDEAEYEELTALKYLQDELLYDKVPDWREIGKMLDKILPEENLFAVNPKDVVRWHDILKKYLGEKPTDQAREKIIPEIIGHNSQAVERFMRSNQKIEAFRGDKELTDKLLFFYDHFEELLKKGV